MHSQNAKYFLQMGDVINRFEAFHHHVVYIYLRSLFNHVLEHLIHQSLVGCPCILQPKMHDLIVV